MDNNYNQNGNYGDYGSNNDNPYMQPNTNQSTNMGQNSPYMQPNPGQGMPYMQPNPGQGMPYMQPQAPKKGCAFGIAALVVGILSMTLCCVGGSVMGIAGIILGIVALCRKESKYGLAIGGIVTSVFGVLIGIYMLVVVVFAGAAYDEIKDMDEKEIENWLQERLDALENEGVSGLDDLQPDANIVTNENPFTGHNFQCEDESVIYFNEDGSFLWYRDDSDHADNYYTGTYEVYMGAEAQRYITEDLAEYGVTERELEEYYERNEGSEIYRPENYCCLVLHNESLYSGGETDYEPNDRHYMGYYYEGYYDAANMESAEYASFLLIN